MSELFPPTTAPAGMRQRRQRSYRTRAKVVAAKRPFDPTFVQAKQWKINVN